MAHCAECNFQTPGIVGGGKKMALMGLRIVDTLAELESYARAKRFQAKYIGATCSACLPKRRYAHSVRFGNRPTMFVWKRSTNMKASEQTLMESVKNNDQTWRADQIIRNDHKGSNASDAAGCVYIIINIGK